MDDVSIAGALASAQKQMGKAFKSANNPHFRSKYADLASVMDACMGALNDNGIAVIQPLRETEFGRNVETIFIHKSGEQLECSIPLIISKNDMQGLGSAITYARRYGLMSLAGIAPEDDDGNAAAASIAVTPPERSWAQTITDELPPNATDRDKASAIAEALCAQFKRKKTAQQLNNEWDRRLPLIEALKKFTDLHEKVSDAFQVRLEEFGVKDEVHYE
jgi:hypothetical protein